MTTEKPLQEHRKANEEEYFRKANAEAAAKLKKRAELEGVGIQDTGLIDHLLACGFDADSARALYVLPLIDVAWADGAVQAAERREILGVLEKQGIATNTKAYGLVVKWIDRGAADESYLQARTLLEPIVQELKKSGKDPAAWIIAASEKVASVTNSLFGLGSKMISKEERSYIEELAKKFS